MNTLLCVVLAFALVYLMFGMFLLWLTRVQPEERCRFGLHPWAKWTVIREGRYVKTLVSVEQVKAGTTGTEDLKNGFGSLFKEQQRECPSCGKIQLRTEYA